MLRPDRMKVVPGPEGWPDANEYSTGSHVLYRLDLQNRGGVRPILYIMFIHLLNDYYGMSPARGGSHRH